MATIQVRDVPDDVHQLYRRRAAAAGMSLQEYLRAELTRSASRLTPAEVADGVQDRLRVEGSDGYLDGSTGPLVRGDRNAG